MVAAVYWFGVVVAGVLLTLLIVTLIAPSWRIWPTPGEKTWQSYLWWPLFRGLNVLCFAAALLDRTPCLGLPTWLRTLAFLLLAGSVALFVYSFRVLGRDNSYGARDGLVTGGIYRWSRNPQNAMLVVVYAALAVAADSASAYVFSGAMMAVYVLMVLAEEPWLAGVYGSPYSRYCERVPRFFSWRRAGLWLRSRLRRSPGRPTTQI